MKKLFLFLTLAVLALATPVFAQNTKLEITPEQLQKMTPSQLQAVQEMLAVQAKNNLSLDTLTPEKIDKYAQMGKGLGIAINQGLSAVTKNVEQFSQTSAGKWLMVLITWKVMGEDAVGLVRTAMQWAIGGTLLIVGIPFWMWIVKRNCVNRPIQSVEKTGFWTKKVVYAEKLPIHDEYTILYGFCFLVYLGACAAIMFIH